MKIKWLILKVCVSIAMMAFPDSDSSRIEQMIARACETGERSVVLSRNAERGDGGWVVERAIVLPDDFTLSVVDTSIRTADGVSCDVVRNQGADSDGWIVNRNIVIRGVGRAEFLGGVRLCGIDGFTVENIAFKDAPGQGVVIALGSSNGRIENISGSARCDIVALCCDGARVLGEISNISVRNVRGWSSGGGALVSLACRNGAKMHDVIVRDIFDASFRKDKRADAVVRIGESAAARGDMYNIIVDGVVSRSKSGVRVEGPLADSSLLNILTSGAKSEPVQVLSMLDRVRTDRPPLETRGIQNAIDAAAKSGGGRVTITEGVHRSGTLRLASGVTLHLEKGAVLLGGERPEDYDDAVPPEIEYDYDGALPATATLKAFIVADCATNIAITGKGTINSRGPAFFDRSSVQWRYYCAKPKCFRPRMVVFNRCCGVRLEGVTFKDSPTWTMWLKRCEDITVSKIRIDCEQRMINSDGIDFDGCRNIRVGDSFFRTGDDSIVLRAIRGGKGEPSVTENVVVSNCVLESACQGVRIGCPSDDTVRNALFRNIVFRGRNAIGSEQPRVYLEKGCSGRLKTENIRFENWTADCWGKAFDIFVDPGIHLPHFGGMTFSNFVVKAEQPSVIRGTDISPIRGLRFIRISGSVADEQPFKVESAPDILFENCKVKSLWRKEPPADYTEKGVRK